jgi:hypothetical protein
MSSEALRRRLASFAVLSAVACSPSSDDGAIEHASAPIVGGTPATAYPEAVVVTSSGIIPCSGVVLAPRVVLTAGHCQSPTKSYVVDAPNAAKQHVTGSDDWTTYDGSATTSSDTLLIFLDTPIALATYPAIADAPSPAGTSVVEVGRTLNGVIDTDDYVSPPVTLQGTGDSLGFPFNYRAMPDISEDGDSGGPVELAGASVHTVVAIVDTDTTEQNINEEEPIDLFARLDVVHDAIEAQIAAHGGLDGGALLTDSGAIGAPDGDAAPSAGSAAAPASGGCDVGARRPHSAAVAWVIALGVALFARRRRHVTATTRAWSRSPAPRS